jgi:hypothetical protein
MIFFRNFTTPLWEIFYGNLLLFFCTLFYLAWWFVSYRPDSSGRPSGVFYLAAAFITGIAAIALLSGGISSLSQDSTALHVGFIALGSSALFIIMLLVTFIIFHRIVTSELIIIHIWLAMEISAVAVLYGTGHFGAGRAAILAALVGIAFVVGMICYVLYYSLDETASFRVGMVPLVTDAFVTAVFLGMLALS